MLSCADLSLVARDPSLPALRLLLDEDVLAELLGGPVVRCYLRYKPGTSCVAAVRLADGQDVLVTAYDVAGRAKAAKTLAVVPPAAVLLHDQGTRLLATVSHADRDLPALAVLADPRRRRRLLRRLLPGATGAEDAEITGVAWKPHRRWVGLTHLDATVVLRAYRPQDAGRAADVLTRLTAAGAATPGLLGHVPALGLLAVQHLPGEDLERATGGGRADAAQVRASGRALAALHLLDVQGLPARTLQAEAAAVQAAAEQVGALLPELSERTRRLAGQLAERLAALPLVTGTLHGDFSADQVVVDGSRAALIDLDRAAVGDPAADLGNAAAALAAHPTALSGGDLWSGYAQTAALPDPEAMAVHTAAALLRRAADPFRTRHPDWRGATTALVEAALVEAALVEGVPRRCGTDLHAAGPAASTVRPGRARSADLLDRSPADLVGPLLGGPVRLEVLKDKPGRRCTSRATGPHGTAIVKVYASQRAPVVAERVAALAGGPAEPAVPRVLLCDVRRHVVVLSEVPGTPFTDALLTGDVDAARRVGRALGNWHGHHRGRPPAGLRPHTAEREGELLLERAAAAPAAIATAVEAAAPALLAPWDCDTVVHRDLYEEQVVLTADIVGLLDLDDVAVGPAELDLGNLAAHLHLLGRRTGVEDERLLEALLEAYRSCAPLDPQLLERCRRLSLLRLACLHRDPGLLPARVGRTS